MCPWSLDESQSLGGVDSVPFVKPEVLAKLKESGVFCPQTRMPHPYGHDEYPIPPLGPPLVTTPPPLDMRPISQVVEAMTKEDKLRDSIRLDEDRRQKLEQDRVDTANVLAAAHNRAFTQAFLLVEKMLQKANMALVQSNEMDWKQYVEDARDVLRIFEQEPITG